MRSISTTVTSKKAQVFQCDVLFADVSANEIEELAGLREKIFKDIRKEHFDTIIAAGEMVKKIVDKEYNGEDY